MCGCVGADVRVVLSPRSNITRDFDIGAFSRLFDIFSQAMAVCKSLLFLFCIIQCYDRACRHKLLTIGGPAVQRGLRWDDVPTGINHVKVRSYNSKSSVYDMLYIYIYIYTM